MKFDPYWWEATPLEVSTTPEIPQKTDVVIVGAGYAGLSAALTLSRAGRSVIVFDAMRAGEGASRRNGGIASGNIKLPFDNMIETFGLDRAKRFYGEGVAAREYLTGLIQAEQIDCDFDPVGRFTGASSPRDYEALGRESDLLNQHFGLGVEMVARADQHRELGTELYYGGQVRPNIAGVHPGLLHRGLLHCAEAAGAVVVAETPVLNIARTNDGHTVTTARGALMARDVIVATNGYTDDAMTWLRRRIIAIPSQIVATEAIPTGTLQRLMPKRRMVGDTRSLYNYYRPSPDQTRIIFGGRRGADSDDPNRKASHLQHNLVEIFPELKGIGLTHSWWGYTGYTFDFLPKLAINDGVRYAVGFCGSGVVWAPWLGMKAALSVLGAAEATSIFDEDPLQTRPLYHGKPWFLPAVIAWYGLKDRWGW